MKFCKFILAVFVTIFCLLAVSTGFCEYRVYELSLTYLNEGDKGMNNNNPGTSAGTDAATSQDTQQVTTRTVLSTLDDLQYPQYHGGSSKVRARIIRTWMCGGDTSGFKKLCTFEERLKDSGKENKNI